MQKGNGGVIALYSRKSRFTGKGESIGNQIELCREYVRRHFGGSAAEQMAVFEDEGFSGGNLNRPAFQKMLEAARNREFRAIIVYRLDRISRNVSDFSGLIEELDRLDVAFISIREQFDTGTPMGRAMMYIASVFSQLERETIAERIRDNMRELAKTGRWLGGTTPTGFASEAVGRVTVDGKTKRVCRLKLIPEEAEKVRMIYDLYMETDSLTLTEAALMKQGCRTKNGKYFTRFSIKGILQNPVYMIADQEAYDYFAEHDAEVFSERSEFDGIHGMMAYHRTDQEKGRTTVFLPVSEWIIAVGKHPGLIPGTVWVSVQSSLERNRSKGYRKPRSNQALLTGLLYCACGSRMYPRMGRRKTADGEVTCSYVCKLKERSKGAVCTGKNADGAALDRAVIGQIMLLREDEDRFIDRLERGRHSLTGNSSDYEQRLAGLRKEQQENEKKMEALVDSLAVLNEPAARAQVSGRIETLGSECRAAEERIRELERFASQHVLSTSEFDRVYRRLSVLGNGIDDAPTEQKRAAVRAVIRRVDWDGTNARVVLFGADGEIEARDAVGCGNDENDCPVKQIPQCEKTHWGEDSK